MCSLASRPKISNEKVFFHSVQVACSQATCPAAVRSSRKPLSSTGMSQKNVAT